MATKTKRLEIRAEAGFIDELNRLAEASGTTRAEVIDRAIGLYATALREIEQGKTIKFAFPDPTTTSLPTTDLSTTTGPARFPLRPGVEEEAMVPPPQTPAEA